jgi:hypothetical protein
VIDADDYRTKDAKALRDAARAEGKTPLLRAQYKAAQIMALRAREFLEHTEFAGILRAASPSSHVLAGGERHLDQGRMPTSSPTSAT